MAMHNLITNVTVVLGMFCFVSSCSKKETFHALNDSEISPKAFDIIDIKDTYGDIASYQFTDQWGPYNLHDPSILKIGDWYYCYSTDVAYGQPIKPGIMVRRSKDLVEWEFRGWALSGLPEEAVNYIANQGARPNEGIWAPYIMKVDNEFRLYYSLASDGSRVSTIGMLTASSPEGPWKESGLAISSKTDGPGTNAIDPSVVVTPSGEHYMYYGSAWDGLFVVKLNPQTGLTATSGDLGKLIIRRGKTNTLYNGNLEAPEIIYNKAQNMYYLFVSYDWIDTKYNVRVFRSNNPGGPFLDWQGKDAVLPEDNNAPMILAPYAFTGHQGWQGVAHCSVFTNDKSEYFMATQGRPYEDKYYMVMHARRMFWTPDGWPLVLPERFANVAQTPIEKSEIVGKYDQIVQGYITVPGYANEQVDPQINRSFETELMVDGTINGDSNNTWSFNAPWLEMHWGGQFVDKVYLTRERDWENKIASTIVMSGFNQDGLSIWLKKKN